MSVLRFQIKGLQQSALSQRAEARRGLGLTASLLIAVSLLVAPRPEDPPGFLELKPADLAFDNQVVGTVGPQLRVRVRNRGAAGLRLDFQNLTGNHPGDFQVDASECQLLAADGECDVRIAFLPQGIGLRTARLSVKAPSGIPALDSVALAGNGTPPDGPPPPAQPIFTVEPSFLSYGALLVGTESDPVGVKLSNTGNGVLHIEKSSLASPDFKLLSQECLHRGLVADESCQIKVAFEPREAGLREGTLEIHVLPPAVTQRVILRGTGLLQELRVSPDPLSFAALPVGDTSSRQQVAINNTGSSPIHLGRVWLAGNGARSFRLADTQQCAGKLLIPGTSCSVDVLFAPPTEGLVTASLNVADSTGSKLGGVALSGLGESRATPEIEVDPWQLEFTPPNPTNQRVAVRNGGSAPLRIETLSLQGPNEKAFRVSSPDCLNRLLQPGERCVVQVRLADTASQKPSRSAEVRIAHNASSEAATVQLHWENVPPPKPELSPKPDTVEFGDVSLTQAARTPPRRAVTFTNSGSVVIRSMRFQIGPPWSKQRAFAVEVNGCNILLELQAQCRIEVSFSPREPKGYSRALTVWDERGNLLASVQLTGVGTQPAVIDRGPGP